MGSLPGRSHDPDANEPGTSNAKFDPALAPCAFPTVQDAIQSMLMPSPYRCPPPPRKSQSAPSFNDDHNDGERGIGGEAPCKPEHPPLPSLTAADVRTASLAAWGCEELFLLGERTSGAWRAPERRVRSWRGENVATDDEDDDYQMSEDGGEEEGVELKSEGRRSTDVEADAAESADTTFSDVSDDHPDFEPVLHASTFVERYRGRRPDERLTLDELVVFMTHQARLRGVPLEAKPYFLLSNPLVHGRRQRGNGKYFLSRSDGLPLCTSSAVAGAYGLPTYPFNSILDTRSIRPVRRDRDGTWPNLLWLPGHVPTTRPKVPDVPEPTEVYATLLDLDNLVLHRAGHQVDHHLLEVGIIAHADVLYRQDTVVEASMLTSPVVDISLDPDCTVWSLCVRPSLAEYHATRSPLRIERIQIGTRCRNLYDVPVVNADGDVAHHLKSVFLGISNVNAPRRGSNTVCFDSASYWRGSTDLDGVATLVLHAIAQICHITFGWDGHIAKRHCGDLFAKSGFGEGVGTKWTARMAKEVLRYLLEPEEFHQAVAPTAFKRAWQGGMFQCMLAQWEAARMIP